MSRERQHQDVQQGRVVYDRTEYKRTSQYRKGKDRKGIGGEEKMKHHTYMIDYYTT
jgi:hypothetical protein